MFELWMFMANPRIGIRGVELRATASRHKICAGDYETLNSFQPLIRTMKYASLQYS